MSITNGCARCKRYPYDPPGVVEPGRQDVNGIWIPPVVIWWYCKDCVKKCAQCGHWRSLWQFMQRRGTEAFKEWRNTSAKNKFDPDLVTNGKLGAGDELGIMTGPDLFEDKCIHCMPFRPVVIAQTVELPVMEIHSNGHFPADYDAALAELIAEMDSG